MDQHTIHELLAKAEQLETAGDIAGAFTAVGTALEQAQAGGAPGWLAEALLVKGKLQFRLGRYEEACRLASEALALLAPAHPARARAWMLLGSCAAETNAIGQAETYFRLAADHSRETGQPRWRMAALHNLAANIYIPRGQFDLALAADEEALSLAERLAAPHPDPQQLRVFPLITITLRHLLSGELERAGRALEQLRGLARPATMASGYADCLEAHLAVLNEDLEPAAGLYDRARSTAEAFGEPGINLLARLGLSEYCRLTGNSPAAQQWAQDAVELAGRLGYHHYLGKAHLERARAMWANGDARAALEDLDRALNCLEPLEARYDLARTLLVKAAILHQEGSLQAKDSFEEAAQAIMQGGFTYLLFQERSLAYPLLAAYSNKSDAQARSSGWLLERLQALPAPPVRLAALGGLQAWVGGKQLARRSLRQRRAGELLVMLWLATKHTLTFDGIADALWPEKDPETAKALFHHATSTLRKALEPDLPHKFPSRYLEVDEGLVSLNLPPGSTFDCADFDAAFRAGDWEGTVRLYAGEFLPECLYAGWTVEPRQWLAQRYQQALCRAAQARFQAGEWAAALEYACSAIRLEPWDEQAVLLGMQACVRLNDIPAALRLYRELAGRLERDLQIAPQVELQAFYAQLVAV